MASSWPATFEPMNTLNPFNPLNPPPQSLQSPHPPEPLQPYTTVLLLYYCNTILITLYLLTTILNNPIPAYWGGGGENLDPMNMFGRFDLDSGGGGLLIRIQHYLEDVKPN